MWNRCYQLKGQDQTGQKWKSVMKKSSKTKENQRPWQQMILSYIVKPKLQHTSKYTGLLCFSKSSYTNRETDKSDTFLLAFCSLSLEGTKGAEVTQLYYNIYGIHKNCLYCRYCGLAFFLAGQFGLHLQKKWFSSSSLEH